jgi:hypothetical protein
MVEHMKDLGVVRGTAQPRLGVLPGVKLDFPQQRLGTHFLTKSAAMAMSLRITPRLNPELYKFETMHCIILFLVLLFFPVEAFRTAMIVSGSMPKSECVRNRIYNHLNMMRKE